MRIVRAGLKKTTLTFLTIVAVVIGGQGLAAEEASSSSAEVEAVVRHIIDAYGGRDVLKNFHSLSARGVLESPMYERPAEYALDLRQDRKLRVEIRSGNSFELRILNGTRGFYRSGDTPLVSVSGSRLLSMVYQFKEITMPERLMDSSFTIDAGGKIIVKGASVRLLLLRDTEGPPMKIYVDMKSGRIVKDSGVFTMGSSETELSSEFHDFRKIDGRLLPFRVVNYAGGQRIGEVHISEYRVNPLLPDSLFSP